MKNLFVDIFDLLKTIRWIDIAFFSLVILLIITFIMIIYVIKLNKSEIVVEEEKNSDQKDFDIGEITKQIEDEYENLNIQNNNNYERSQEEQAIISYDELLANTGEFHLEYDEEYETDPEIQIKKIKKAVHIEDENLRKYNKEEKYLEYLKTLKNK